MPNLAGVLKEEIRRLARKEVRAELAATKKASAKCRKEIAALKRQVGDQARTLAAVQRSARTNGSADSAEVTTARFSPNVLSSAGGNWLSRRSRA